MNTLIRTIEVLGIVAFTFVLRMIALRYKIKLPI